MLVPATRPRDTVGVDGREEEVLDKPDMSLTIAIKTMLLLEIDKEILPFLDEAVAHIQPQAFDPDVVDTATPEIRPTLNAPENFHSFSNADVLNAVITTDTAGSPMNIDELKEELKHSGGAIVVASSDASDEARIAIHKRVNDDLPVDEA